jgi:HD superfamily phosphohydrolase
LNKLTNVAPRAEILVNHEERSVKLARWILTETCSDVLEVWQIDAVTALINPGCALECVLENALTTTSETSETSETFEKLRQHGVQQFMYEIVNNTVHKVDVDKMDYLVRDTQHWVPPQQAGRVVKTFGIVDIIRNARVVDDHWCFDIEHRDKIESLVHQRYVLHKSFYGDPRCQALEEMVSDVFLDCAKQLDLVEIHQMKCVKHLEKFSTLTDHLLFDIGFNNALENIPETTRSIARNIFNGSQLWYRHVGDFSKVPRTLKPDYAIVREWDVEIDVQRVDSLLPLVLFHFGTLRIWGLHPKTTQRIEPCLSRSKIYRVFARIL